MILQILLLLSAGLLLVIFRIARQIIAAWRCVEEETLIDFWNGRLQSKDQKEYNRVVAHLGNCQKCRDRLDEITQNNKTRYNVDDHLISRRF